MRVRMSKAMNAALVFNVHGLFIKLNLTRFSADLKHQNSIV